LLVVALGDGMGLKALFGLCAGLTLARSSCAFSFASSRTNCAMLLSCLSTSDILHVCVCVVEKKGENRVLFLDGLRGRDDGARRCLLVLRLLLRPRRGRASGTGWEEGDGVARKKDE
jgi:hypothetical protein